MWPNNVELQVFVEASTEAYGTVTYLESLARKPLSDAKIYNYLNKRTNLTAVRVNRSYDQYST